MCSEADYYYYTSECDAYGVATLTYVWNTNPPSCHGGVSLPPSQSIGCAFTVYCGPGFFFDLDSNDCVPAPAGFYSVGNGFRVTNWTELEDGFSSMGFTGTAQHLEI